MRILSVRTYRHSIPHSYYEITAEQRLALAKEYAALNRNFFFLKNPEEDVHIFTHMNTSNWKKMIYIMDLQPVCIKINGKWVHYNTASLEAENRVREYSKKRWFYTIEKINQGTPYL